MTKRILMVFLAVIIAMGCGMLGACSKKNSPSATVEKFAQGLNEDNILKMTECIDPEILNSIGSFQEGGEVSLVDSALRIIKLIPFISYIEEETDFLPEYDVSILSEEINGENATVKIKAIDKRDSYEYVLDVFLKLANEKWYIEYALPTVE